MFLPIIIIMIQLYRRREPPDSMSLRYADSSLPDVLGRPRLRYAEISMGNTSKCAFVIQTVFSTSVLNLFFYTYCFICSVEY